MKQTFEHIKLEIPALDFKIPAVGIVKFSFDLLQCKDFVVSNETKGFYLIQDHLGLSIKFSVVCSTKVTQSKNGSAQAGGFLGSSISLNVTGSYFMGEMGFGHDKKHHQIIPIMQKLDAAFDHVDVLKVFVNHRL
jgi:hypothetical protein